MILPLLDFQFRLFDARRGHLGSLQPNLPPNSHHNTAANELILYLSKF